MRATLLSLLTLFSQSACAAPATCPRTAEQGAAEPPAAPVTAGAERPARRGSVLGLRAAPRRQAPSGKAWVQLLAQGDNAFVGKLEMAPGARVPEHQDATEEYIHVLEGHGTITIDGTRYELTPGSTVFMPAGATVSYENGDAKLVAIQVFAGPAPAAKYDSWAPAPPPASEE